MLPFYVTDAVAIDNPTGFKYRTVYLYNENSKLHYHSYYEIFLVLAPQIVHIINDSRQVLLRGTLVFIRKEDVHAFEYTSAKEPSLVNLSFSEEIIQELFQYLSEGYPSQTLLTLKEPPSVMMNEPDIAWVLSQLEKLNSTMKDDIPQLKYHCRLFLLKIFTRYFSKATAEMPSPDSKIPGWLQILDREMHKLEHFSKGSEHMIEMSEKSHEYLSRMMKKHYGKTISEYISDLRLNYWANVLANSDTPILDICYECGFQNVSWAYTLFKKKYGVSPSKYRQTSM